ncbi:hypothetical protein EDB81DRAFT_818226 [Dactylonectria macrodidyma]|uniref:Uncharacterized protein n=1 Tax=Dactylonectria macrodidyma TaxID=307937 RepID=A0A9P9DDV0_9HYPO|nr:hypothetical protein EDB81DRAFT_818226 [Dactylonectria macrodidyma]
MITRKVEKFFYASQMQAHYCGATHNLELLVQQLALDVEPDPSRIAASGALEYLEGYYMVAMKRFIDDVSAEVIETEHLSPPGLRHQQHHDKPGVFQHPGFGPSPQSQEPIMVRIILS